MLHLQRAVKINWSRTNKLPIPSDLSQVFGCANEIHLVVLGRKKKYDFVILFKGRCFDWRHMTTISNDAKRNCSGQGQLID